MDKKTVRLEAIENQVRRLRRRIERLNSVSIRYSWSRLALFIALAAICIVAFGVGGGIIGWIAIAVSVVVFNVVAYFHRKIVNSLNRHKAWLDIKLNHLARMKLDWPNIPMPTPLPPHDGHPFETDLDMTGPRSIHHLLDTAITREGSARLGEWLLSTTPDPATIARRQTLVKELVGIPAFRDRLTMNANLAASSNQGQLEARSTLKWLNKQKEQQGSLAPILIILAVLSAVSIVGFLVTRLADFPNLWVFTLLAFWVLYIFNLSRVGNMFESASELRDGLRQLSAVLSYLEDYHYGRRTALKTLCQPFLDKEVRPSNELRKVATIAGAAVLNRNGILWLIVNALVPYDMFWAWSLQRRRAVMVKHLPVWLDTWFELEALNSLATYAYLNPQYTFAQVRPDAIQPVLVARQIGHPLIPDGQKVCNDFALDRPDEIVIITGSNMAGKSSFLRTLGVNLAVTYAGGPVNADYLELSLYRLFTCIKVSDSVTDGFSYFYAEVRRLKALLQALQQPDALPLFFLIDEIFRGTNNQERLIGSRAYLKALVGQNGIGFVSTHDLELVKLADEIEPIRNYHFREEVVDGQMVFDYTLRPGPSPTTNALKIMQLEGLPVS